jgi:hypothetical protein
MKNFSKRNDLYSIKPIEDKYKDRLFLQDFFSNLLLHSSVVIVHAMRPFGDTEKSFSKLNNITQSLHGLQMNKKSSSFSFWYYPQPEENYDFVQTFIEIWFDFEHPGFIFLIDDDLKTIEFLMNNKLLSWKDIERIAKGFCVFRDVEEDVLWISKHPELSFGKIIEE